MTRIFFISSILLLFILAYISLPYLETATFFLLISFTLLCFLPIVLKRDFNWKNLSIHSPDIITGFVFFVYMGYGTYVMYAFPDLRRNSSVNNQSLFNALIFCYFSLLLLYIGFYNRLNLRINLFPFYKKVKLIDSPWIILYFFLLGLFGKTIEIFSGYYYLVQVNSIIPYYEPNSFFGFANFGPILSLFSIFSFLYSFYLYNLTKRKVYLIYFLLIFIFEILVGFPTGSKEKLIKPVVYFILYLSLMQKLSLKFVLSFVVIVVFFVFPFVTLYRSSGNDFSNFLTSYFNKENFSYSEGRSMEIGNRLSGVAIVASVIDQTPSVHDYTYGRDYLNTFLALIPRVFWPDKPIVLDHNAFGRKYNLVSPNDFVTSVTPYWFGEAFINFSYFGVFVGIFYGLFLKNLSNIYYRNPNIMSIFIMLMTIYIYSRHSQFVATIMGVLQGYVLIVFASLPFLYRVK